VKPFFPLLPNPHLATIAANFWPRRFEEWRYPVEAKLFHTEPSVRILVHIQRPKRERPKGEVVLVHGLEGSSNSGYMQSLAQVLLDDGWIVHRTNIRTCGGTEFLCDTLYHAGLTSDLFAYLMDLDKQRRTPIWLVGFSLGGNQVLKLAGEMGTTARRVLAGVCAVSAPIDLRACSVSLEERRNQIYQYWYTSHMVRRLKVRKKVLGDKIPWDGVEKLKSVYGIDDRVTGPAFGFTGADHYYQTQSAQAFIDKIAIPCLLVQSKDDPLIPYRIFEQPAVQNNRHVTLATADHGGHIGFISRSLPRFWVDAVIRDWFNEIGNNVAG
jgi:predicted alpha/beta-fold hydrolase